jgi:hypothetical protein
MRIHRDDFRTLLADKQPSWEEVAAALAAMGLRDADGKPPTADRTRKAWWAVRHAKTARPAKRTTRPDKPAQPPLAPNEITPAVRTAPDSSQAETTSRPRLHLDIRPAVPLAGNPAITATAAPPPSALAAPMPTGSPAPSPSAHHAVDAQLQRLRQQIDASKVPLPKIVG